MGLFREFVDDKRERNRSGRFGGWKGIVIKIVVLIAVFYFFRNFTRESAETLLWFMRGGG